MKFDPLANFQFSFDQSESASSFFQSSVNHSSPIFTSNSAESYEQWKRMFRTRPLFAKAYEGSIEPVGWPLKVAELKTDGKRRRSGTYPNDALLSFQ